MAGPNGIKVGSHFLSRAAEEDEEKPQKQMFDLISTLAQKIIIEVLIEKLVKSGLVVLGESLFREMIPSEVSVCVMMRSPLIGIKINRYITDW